MQVEYILCNGQISQSASVTYLHLLYLHAVSMVKMIDELAAGEPGFKVQFSLELLYAEN